MTQTGFAELDALDEETRHAVEADLRLATERLETAAANLEEIIRRVTASEAATGGGPKGRAEP